MPEDDVRALADSLVVQAHNHNALIRNAMRRIAELEVQRALIDAHAMAASIRTRKQSKLRAVLHWVRRCWQWRR